VIGDLSHSPPASPQAHVPGDHPTCEKVVIVRIGVWITVALSPKVHRNQVRPELGGSVIFQGNDEAAGEMLCGLETAQTTAMAVADFFRPCRDCPVGPTIFASSAKS